MIADLLDGVALVLVAVEDAGDEISALLRD